MPTAPTPPTPPTPPKAPVFLRLPAALAEALDSTAHALDVAKSALVADALAEHLGREGLVGRHSFTRVQELDVLTLEQLAELLDVEVDAARELAEAGEVPGRRIGDRWRFAREAVMDWLAGK
jgi:excisionase family DNA binding protein